MADIANVVEKGRVGTPTYSSWLRRFIRGDWRLSQSELRPFAPKITPFQIGSRGLAGGFHRGLKIHPG